MSVRRHVGYMPDFFGVYEGITSAEYLDFFAATQRIRPSARPAVVADLLALVDLEDKAERRCQHPVAGDEAAAVARPAPSSTTRPSWCSTSPRSGLDPRARVELRELIGELHRMQRTVVISSHILSELEGICSHLAVVDHGRILAQGSMPEVRAQILAARRVTARIEDGHVERAEAVLKAATGGVRPRHRAFHDPAALRRGRRRVRRHPRRSGGERGGGLRVADRGGRVSRTSSSSSPQPMPGRPPTGRRHEPGGTPRAAGTVPERSARRCSSRCG